MAKNFDKSLTVSVFPVPAGPITDKPQNNLSALVIVKKHLSVN